MKAYGIVVHGGAGPDSDYIRENLEQYKAGISAARDKGFAVLEQGGTSLDAVTTAVATLEDDPLFNAGVGSSLTEKRRVEMCASIMNGAELKTGAATLLAHVKNPVKLARAIMEEAKYEFLGGGSAEDFARQIGLELKRNEEFFTDHQCEVYETALKEQRKPVLSHGTVGAVACDSFGNLVAATSTGGTEMRMQGRISDSALIGSGTYANNKTCAISCTGEGEKIIQHILAADISAVMEYKKYKLKEACKYVLHTKLKDVDADIGLIAITSNSEICLLFKSERMHRAWKVSTGESGVGIYK